MKKFIQLGDNTTLFNIDHIVQIFISNHNLQEGNLQHICLELTNSELAWIERNLTETEAMTKLAEYQEELNNCYN